MGAVELLFLGSEFIFDLVVLLFFGSEFIFDLVLLLFIGSELIFYLVFQNRPIFNFNDLKLIINNLFINFFK